MFRLKKKKTPDLWSLPLNTIINVTCIIKKKKISPRLWNYAHKDKRDGQKYRFTLKSYDGWKDIDLRDTEGVKIKL